MTTKTTKCHHCRQSLTQKAISHANDADIYVAEYGIEDDNMAWIARDGSSICDTNRVAHITTREWESAL